MAPGREGAGRFLGVFGVVEWGMRRKVAWAAGFFEEYLVEGGGPWEQMLMFGWVLQDLRGRNGLGEAASKGHLGRKTGVGHRERVCLFAGEPGEWEFRGFDWIRGALRGTPPTPTGTDLRMRFSKRRFSHLHSIPKVWSGVF